MVYRGQVKNGVIVPDEPIRLPEGARVVIETEPESASPTLLTSLGDLVGKAEGLPPDFAANHDHYIHGTPRK